jgi:hemolysin III
MPGRVESLATKPLLRGVSHQVAALAALFGWAAIVAAAPTSAARTAAHVYAASLFALFAVSATYHTPTWSPVARAWMRRIDHAAIFMLIAGTYTPLCLLLGGRRGMGLLLVVWIGAVGGVVQSVLWVRAPKALAAAIYVVLGWVVLPVLPAMRAVVGTWGLALLAVGGISYTIGAVVYSARAPNPWPRVFGYHEVFHALVIVAAACHFAVAFAAVRGIR